MPRVRSSSCSVHWKENGSIFSRLIMHAKMNENQKYYCDRIYWEDFPILQQQQSGKRTMQIKVCVCVCLLTHTYVSKHCTQKSVTTRIYLPRLLLYYTTAEQIRTLLIGPVPLQQPQNYKFWSKSKTKSNRYENMQDTKESHVKQTLHRWGQQHGVQPGWGLSSRGTSRRTKQG